MSTAVLVSSVKKISRFLKWIIDPEGQSKPARLPAYNPDPDYTVAIEDVPRYPPFDSGLPFVSVERVLQTQQTLITQISRANIPGAEEAVRNLAAYIHLLPATPDDYFCGAGGLLRMSLETAWHSYIAAQGNVLTAKDPTEKRRELDAKWQLASFMAGLCAGIGPGIVSSVLTNDSGQQWAPFEPLTDWLRRTGSHRYFLRPPRTKGPGVTPTEISGVLLRSIIPASVLHSLTTDDREILLQMVATISRISDLTNSTPFSVTVRKIYVQVIDRDRKTNPMSFGRPLVGAHIEPWLINAMRKLVREDVWKINQKLARVHVAPDGTFIFWTTGVPELIDDLRREGVTGIPSEPRSLGELLMREEVFVPNAEGGLWWYILPPGAPKPYEVVKLANPAIIIDDAKLAATKVYDAPITVAAPSGAAAAVVPSPQDDAPSPDPAPPASQAPDYSVVLKLTAGSIPPSPTGPVPGRDRSGHVESPKVRKKPKPGPAHATPAPSAIGPSSSNSPSGDTTIIVVSDASELLRGRASPSTDHPAPPRDAPAQVPDDALLKWKEMLSMPSTKADIVAMLDQHNRGDAPTFWTEHGLALPIEWVGKMTDRTRFVGTLRPVGVFWTPDDKRPLVPFTRDGREVKSLVIRRPLALAFGFEPETRDTHVHKVEPVS